MRHELLWLLSVVVGISAAAPAQPAGPPEAAPESGVPADLSWRFETDDDRLYVAQKRVSLRSTTQSGARTRGLNVQQDFRLEAAGDDPGRVRIGFGPFAMVITADGEPSFSYVDAIHRDVTGVVLSPNVRYQAALRDGSVLFDLGPKGIGRIAGGYDALLDVMVDFIEGHGIEDIYLKQFLREDVFTRDFLEAQLGRQFGVLPGKAAVVGEEFELLTADIVENVGVVTVGERYVLREIVERDGRRIAIAEGAGVIQSREGALSATVLNPVVEFERNEVRSRLEFLLDEGRVWEFRREYDIVAKVRWTDPAIGASVADVEVRMRTRMADSEAGGGDWMVALPAFAAPAPNALIP